MSERPEALALLRIDLERDEGMVRALAEQRPLPEPARRRYVELLDRILLAASDGSVVEEGPPVGAIVRSSRSYAPGMVTVPGRHKELRGRIPVLYEWGLRFEWPAALEVIAADPKVDDLAPLEGPPRPGTPVLCPTPRWAFDDGECGFELVEGVVTSVCGEAVYVRRVRDRRSVPVPIGLVGEPPRSHVSTD